MKVIIYKTENEGVAICTPTEEALSFATIEEIAKKDVPFGTDYAIINSDEIPTDRTFRNAWELSEDTIYDGMGGESDEFPEELFQHEMPEEESDDSNQ